MNINELLQELELMLYDYKHRLYEFAMPLGTLKDKIQDKTPIIFLHLCKVIAFGKDHPQTVRHWCTELGGFLKICNMKVKSTKKVLKVDTIMNFMLEVYSDVKEFGSISGELYGEYGQPKMSDGEIYDKIKKVLPNLITYIQQLPENEPLQAEIIEKLIFE